MPCQTRYTKRQYQIDIEANQREIAAIKTEIEALASKAENGVSEALTERFNAAHDRQYGLELERRAIESRWTQRNWTASDYAAHDLASQNID